MSVTLTGNGGIFTRLGHLAGIYSDVIALLGGSATARVLSGASLQTRGATINADAAYSPSMVSIVDGVWTTIAAEQSAQVTFLSALATLAQNIMISQVQLDAKLQSPTLVNCITELIRQMRASVDSLQSSTVGIGAQTAVGSPVGNPIVLVGDVNTRGEILQTLFAETLRFAVTADQNSGATLRQEPMSVKGNASVPVTAWNWPQGSAASLAALNLVDAQLNNSGGNLLYNSDFETFHSNYPEDWVVRVGAAGTDILAGGSGNAYTLVNCLEFAGDGATNSTIYQPFSTTHSTVNGNGGTPYKILPATRYGVNAFTKVISSAPAAGVLRVALVDGSNVVINSDGAVANSFTIDLTAETTSYAAHSHVFCTPTNLPAVVRLELRLSTPITNLKNVCLDDLAMTPLRELYVGGPVMAAFAGAPAVVKGDAWTSALTNTMGLMAMAMEKFFAMRSLGLQFPLAGSPTVSDSLVV